MEKIFQKKEIGESKAHSAMKFVAIQNQWNDIARVKEFKNFAANWGKISKGLVLEDDRVLHNACIAFAAIVEGYFPSTQFSFTDKIANTRGTLSLTDAVVDLYNALPEGEVRSQMDAISGFKKVAGDHTTYKELGFSHGIELG